MLERLPPGSRIAVIRLRSLGDCVLTTPALSLLKQHRPDLRIAVMVEERFQAVYDLNPDIDSILPPQLGELRKWKPALTLNLHGGTRSMMLTALSGARFRAGFAHHRYRLLYTHKIPTAQRILNVDRTVHTAEHVASAMFYLGVPQGEIPRAKLVAPRGDLLIPARAALIHPFASAPDKTWPFENFLSVAGSLQRQGMTPIFLSGPGDPSNGYQGYRVMHNLPLAQVKLVLSHTELFIGNDSGPAHMAAAFGIPSVVLFGNSDLRIWSPWRTPGRVLQAPDGISGITVNQVLDAVNALNPLVRA
jgi:ADP-heptose:LPS heptosyltransferase